MSSVVLDFARPAAAGEPPAPSDVYCPPWLRELPPTRDHLAHDDAWHLHCHLATLRMETVMFIQIDRLIIDVLGAILDQLSENGFDEPPDPEVEDPEILDSEYVLWVAGLLQIVHGSLKTMDSDTGRLVDALALIYKDEQPSADACVPRSVHFQCAELSRYKALEAAHRIEAVHHLSASRPSDIIGCSMLDDVRTSLTAITLAHIGKHQNDLAGANLAYVIRALRQVRHALLASNEVDADVSISIVQRLLDDMTI